MTSRLKPIVAVAVILLAAVLMWQDTARPPGVSGGPHKKPLAPRSGGNPSADDVVGTRDAPQAPTPGSDLSRLQPTAENLAVAMEQHAARSRDGGAQAAWDASTVSTTSPSDSDATREPAARRATLDKEDIRAAVKAAMPAFKHCYESGQKVTPDSEGKVTVSFTLVASDGGGFMREGEIKSSDLGNPLIDACLLDAMAHAQFPVPDGEGEVRVTYPLKFAKD